MNVALRTLNIACYFLSHAAYVLLHAVYILFHATHTRGEKDEEWIKVLSGRGGTKDISPCARWPFT